MKFALVAVALLAFASAAGADEFGISGVGQYSTIHLGPNGDIDPGPTVETFGVTFIYDPLSRSVADMSVTSQGPLGNDFVFTGVTDDGVNTFFQWSNDEATVIGFCADSAFAVASHFPFSASCDGTKGLNLACLNAECINDFLDPITGKPTLPFGLGDLFVGPSPVPEPSSLTLLASGLLAAVFLLRRRKRREIAHRHSAPSGSI